jgi:DNA mismatch endonuclease (patch repair protein)
MICKVDAFLNPQPHVSAQMRRQLTRDTTPEMAVRRLLHARGLRFRKHYPVPGAPRRSIDVAFPRSKVAIFIDGCYWHGCVEHRTIPKNNASSWRAKIDANRARDADTDAHLLTNGWTVIRCWEHDAPSFIVEAVVGHLDRAADRANLPLSSRGE